MTRCNAVTSTFDARFRYVDITRYCLGRKSSEITSEPGIIPRNPYGAPTALETYVDAAGASVTTQIAYSALGREYYRYTETGAGQTQYLTANVMNCPAGTAYKAMQNSAVGSASQECFDVLGRVTRSLTLGFCVFRRSRPPIPADAGRVFRTMPGQCDAVIGLSCSR